MLAPFRLAAFYYAYFYATVTCAAYQIPWFFDAAAQNFLNVIT